MLEGTLLLSIETETDTYVSSADPVEMERNEPANKNLYCLHHGNTETCLYNFNPLKPLFYIVKQGFTWYTLFFLFLLKNIDCGYSLEPPR